MLKRWSLIESGRLRNGWSESYLVLAAYGALFSKAGGGLTPEGS